MSASSPRRAMQSAPSAMSASVGEYDQREKGEAMTTRVMVTLQDEVYRRVERLAQLTSRDVADLLADTITLALPPLAVSAESVPAITSLSDEEVLGFFSFR